MSVFIVTAAARDAANAAAGEEMFTVPVPGDPTHFIAGWDFIPDATRAAVLAAGAVAYPDRATADAALGIVQANPRADAYDALADALTDSPLASERELADHYRTIAALERGV